MPCEDASAYTQDHNTSVHTHQCIHASAYTQDHNMHARAPHLVQDPEWRWEGFLEHFVDVLKEAAHTLVVCNGQALDLQEWASRISASLA